MKDFETTVKEIKKILSQKIIELNDLEKEKMIIISNYEAANKEDKERIKKEMDNSEKKFETLSNEVSVLAKKVEKLKKSLV